MFERGKWVIFLETAPTQQAYCFVEYAYFYEVTSGMILQAHCYLSTVICTCLNGLYQSQVCDCPFRTAREKYKGK